MKPTAYACALTEADRVAGCGGKAAQLARLLGMGLAVPPGFVVTDAALQAFLDHNGLRQAADNLGGQGSPGPLGNGTPEDPEALASNLRQRILAGELPPPVRETLHSQRATLSPHATLIVRSSAVGEDGVAASFAGQLDSILDVTAEAALEQALRACWASYWSARALFYQRSRGVRLDGMGVIIQEQVQPTRAGVLFTRNPDRAAGCPDDLLVEYCRGHGEALVQGRVNPGRALISRRDMRVRHLAFGEEDGSSPREAALVELAEAGLAIERAYGLPQDIEWALDSGDCLWLVQARPITTPSHAPPTGRSRVLWSNANVNENYPEPISPLLYSIALTSYYHYFRNLGLAFGLAPTRVATMEQPLRHIIGVHGARMYYHLTNIHAVLRAAPFGERLAEYFSAFTGAEPPGSPEKPGTGWGAWFEAAVIGCKAFRVFRSLPGRVTEFERTVDAIAESTTPEKLAEAPLSVLLDRLRGFLDIRFHRWTNASLADAASMISYGLLKHLLRREFPDADQSALHNTLLKGLTDLVSGQPVTELWRLSRLIRADPALAARFASLDSKALLETLRQDPKLASFRSAFDEYLRCWGFRRSGELMLTVPGFQEQPEPLLDILRAYAIVDGEDPLERLHRQQAERTAETERVLRILGGRRLFCWLPWPSLATVTRRLLRWCQNAIALRERARMRQALLYSRCRGIALAIGRKLTASGVCDQADDVFFLTYQEIDDLLSGCAMFPHQVRDLVRLRRSAHAELSAWKPPDVLWLAGGTYLPLHRTPEASLEGAATAATGAGEMAGVGACGGQVTGPAAVLTDVADCGRLAPGDVLVTRQTDPGWGPAFLLIRGLVLERGGMLSHGAILAREYGIPSVVGVRDAVQRIRPGQALLVDGDRGVVRLVDR